MRNAWWRWFNLVNESKTEEGTVEKRYSLEYVRKGFTSHEEVGNYLRIKQNGNKWKTPAYFFVRKRGRAETRKDVP